MILVLYIIYGRVGDYTPRFAQPVNLSRLLQCKDKVII
jgi:hypothetical protein